MKVLQLHCSEFSYKVTKETPVAEHPASPKEGEYENVLVCFTCYEKQDESRHPEIIEAYVENMKTDTGRIGCKKVMLYPYAHLSHTLGSPRKAKQFLNDLKEKLEEEGLDVEKSPFGWYKAFGLYCKGHPLAEAYREY
ncbi:MAG: threonyl-tRNA synthetase editing domain-containing protein [Candidatus Bathyarchaeota archaeon]|nr:threonyl-tRNA synthetase editing domain-containing protein [Candidatus Bathyarchaeota archaeon]